MKKKRIGTVPRPVLKSLVTDIKKLVVNDEGRLFLLEIIEEIPYDMRPAIIESLSAFYDIEMVSFFHLLKWEYGKEMELLCNRALEKYSMAGIDVKPPEIFNGDFYRAYASCSRHTGKITLDVAWKSAEKELHVECFYLTFNPDGVHSFFLLENMPWQQYEEDRISSADMIELSFKEACFLVSSAYEFNVRHMNRPALGKYLYQKYLDYDLAPDSIREKELIRKISIRLAPRQVVNSFFYALRYQDAPYAASLFYGEDTIQSDEFTDFNSPGKVLLEGEVNEVYGSQQTARVTAYTLFLKEYTVYRNSYCFYLQREEAGNWLITDIERVKNGVVESQELNPFNIKVFCRVYEVNDIDELFDVLDKVENIKEVEELPSGMHMRVSSHEDDFNHGVSLLSGVIADLVLNGDEFVVIAREHAAILDFHNILTSETNAPVLCRGEYEVSFLNACNYLGGRYIYFEDILLGEEELMSEDGMRLICARYLVKDSKPVRERIEKFKNLEFEISEEYQIYYQFADCCGEPGFFAEYVLGPNWVTLSTFGERDMNVARRNFEDKMYDYLEFDGMELKTDSIFDVLTIDVKKEYPQLESILKEIYLNKWYNSNLTTLLGMSPSEASQSEEGIRLLWALFKKIRQKEKKKYLSGRRNNLNLKEYIRKVEQKRGKH
ncbi:MAG: hypothetical protein PHC92_03005 [Syntrophomonadaceae bacterium]|nr:hypothetical protein [Syntrophomonadaceae bacterium]MDD3022589.1 hypothetical protein [Syntrophomonadaceae bacterium]